MTEPSALIPPVLQAVHIRFLNASTAPFPIDVLIDGMEHLQNSSFGTVSQYIPMADGFQEPRWFEASPLPGSFSFSCRTKNHVFHS